MGAMSQALLMVSAGAGSDPLFSSVELLSPMSDVTGTTGGFFDVKSNTWVVTQTGAPEESIQTDATRTLFGLNTLRFNFAGAQNLETAYVDSTKIKFTAATGFCIEYFIWQSSVVGNATIVPAHLFYVAASAGTPDFSRKVGASTYSIAGQFRTSTGAVFNGPYAFPFNQWNYVVIDYDPAAAKTYVYMNGTLIDTYSGYQMGNADIGECYLMLGGTLNTGMSLYAFDVSIGQVRLTSKPRYAGAATIPIPTQPWPQH